MDQSLGNARKELVGILQQIAEGSLELDGIYAALSELAKRVKSDFFVIILSDTLETTNGRIRMCAAFVVLVMDHRTLPRKQAIDVLENCLQQGPLDDRLQAAWYLLYTSEVTERAIPALSQLREVTSEEDYRSLWVAGAIFQAAEPEGIYEELRGEAMWQLLKSLRQRDNPDKVFFAAIALRDEQFHVSEVCSSLMAAYEFADLSTKVAILGQLGKIGGSEPPARKFLMSLGSSSVQPADIRLAAIHSLAWASEATPEVDAILLQVMQGDDCGMVLQAASVLFRREKTLPPIAANLLISYLSHPAPEFRNMAALSLISDPPALNRAIPILIQRLEVEEVDEIAEAVVTAIGECGKAAIEPLVEAITSSSHHRLVRYQTALLEASRDQSELVARLIANENPLVSGVAGWVVGTMGPVSAPAVPILNQLLASKNSIHVQNALIALRSIGPAAATCAKSLVRLLSHEVEEIRIWAESTLLRIGPVVVPTLTAWRNTHPDDRSAALERIFQQLAPLPLHSSENRGVDSVRSQNDLELFYHVSQLLTERGPLSLRALAGKLQELQEAGNVRSDLPCSDRQIGLVIDRLEEGWSNHIGQPIRLVDRGTKRKGGLTADGQKYARLVDDYLKRLTASRDGFS